MASSTGSHLPPGISEPLAVDTSEDHSGFAAIITAAFLGFVLGTLGIRAYVQYSRHVVKKDDYVLLGATILLCIQSSLIFVQIARGWGTSMVLLPPPPHTELLKATYAVDILYVVTHCLSKCSAAIFYLRISPNRTHFIIVWVLVGVATIWALISVILLALRCDNSHPWIDINGSCSTLFPRWQFIAAFDIITEIGLASVSIFLVAGVQMAVERKFVVVLAFSSRLLVILPAAFHLHYIKKLLDSADPTLIGSYVTICAQIELSYGIMANTIPCLKPFMAAYEDTGNKPSYRSRSPDGSPNNGSGAFKKDADSSNTSNTYVLSKISSNISSRFRNPWTSGALATHSRNNSISNPLAQHPQPPPRSKQPLRTDDVRYTATVGPGSWPDSQERQDQSLESHDSKRLVIKKDVKWNVECSRCGALDGFASSAPEVEGQSKTTTTPA
ncbi:hypothetical protein FQN55_000147 [Onygenales sp. PD_40]|nr:hypothetical protein FQN55_000147 [Onygenales sp. PD_40]